MTPEQLDEWEREHSCRVMEQREMLTIEEFDQRIVALIQEVRRLQHANEFLIKECPRTEEEFYKLISELRRAKEIIAKKDEALQYCIEVHELDGTSGQVNIEAREALALKLEDE